MDNKNKQLLWIIGIVVFLIYLGNKVPTMSVLGVEKGYTSHEPTQLTTLLSDFGEVVPNYLMLGTNFAFVAGDELFSSTDSFSGYIIVGGDISKIYTWYSSEENKNEVGDECIAKDCYDSSCYSACGQYPICTTNCRNQQITCEQNCYNEELNILKQGKCDVLINYLLANNKLAKVDTLKGRDIFSPVSTSDYSENNFKGFCANNNKLVIAGSDKTLNWYFDKYITPGTGGTTGEEWIKGVPNWVVVVGGIMILFMFMMMKK